MPWRRLVATDSRRVVFAHIVAIRFDVWDEGDHRAAPQHSANDQRMNVAQRPQAAGEEVRLVFESQKGSRRQGCQTAFRLRIGTDEANSRRIKRRLTPCPHSYTATPLSDSAAARTVMRRSRSAAKRSTVSTS